MKYLITLLLVTFYLMPCYAQNNTINYKAFIKDDVGNVIANQTINIRFIIRKTTGNNFYIENHTTTTNSNGLVILNIGEGETILGSFEEFDWKARNYSLRVGIDIEQDGNYIYVDDAEFKSVPYALSSADNLWRKNGDDAYALTDRIGIGTQEPSAHLTVEDSVISSIKLVTPFFYTESEMAFENGSKDTEYTFFKISNKQDRFYIAADSDLTSATDYENIFELSPTGNIITKGSLRLDNGVSVNEFSTDVTLSSNAPNTTVPTQSAVKTYINNALANFVKEKTIAASGFQINRIDGAEFNYYLTDGVYFNPWDFNILTPNIEYFLIAPLVLPTYSTLHRIIYFFKDPYEIANYRFSIIKDCHEINTQTSTIIHSDLFDVNSNNSTIRDANFTETISPDCSYSIVIQIETTPSNSILTQTRFFRATVQYIEN